MTPQAASFINDHFSIVRWPGRSSTVHDPKTIVLLSYGPTVLCPIVICPIVICLLSYVLWTLMSYGLTVLCPMVLESYAQWLGMCQWEGCCST